MAITGIDTIEGKQIIAAGAVSAKSAEMAYNDENGNPITGYQVAGDYLTTADSANFYTTANPSGFISEVPAGTMNESAFEYDENDKISGYNGSAFAGGSDVPEGVMVESGLEYNAVNEISGYNGSAIAQYGAEKQWLVHDDTLVHASNSAQYALGVNLSAVAQLLGVDETVLWSGSIGTNSTATLSEPYTSFERIRIAGTCSNGAVSNEAYSNDLSAASIHELSLSKPTMLSTGEADGTYNIIAFMPCLFNGSTVETKNGRFLGYWGGKWQYQTNTAFTLTKIIGIGRKQ